MGGFQMRRLRTGLSAVLASLFLVGAGGVAAFGLHAVHHDSCRTEQRRLLAQLTDQAGPGLAERALRTAPHTSCQRNIDPDEHYVGIEYELPRGVGYAGLAQTLRENGWRDHRGGESSMRSPDGRFELNFGFDQPTGHPFALLYTFQDVPSG